MIISLRTVQIHKQKKPEQIQLMYDLDKGKTVLTVLAANTYVSLIRTNSDNAIVDHLNLYKVKMTPPHLCL